MPTPPEDSNFRYVLLLFRRSVGSTSRTFNSCVSRVERNSFGCVRTRAEYNERVHSSRINICCFPHLRLHKSPTDWSSQFVDFSRMKLTAEWVGWQATRNVNWMWINAPVRAYNNNILLTIACCVCEPLPSSPSYRTFHWSIGHYLVFFSLSLFLQNICWSPGRM